MIGTLQRFGFDALVTIGVGLGVIVLLRFARAVLDALPMSRARRALVARIRPLLGGATIVLYALFASAWLLRDTPHLMPLAVVIVALVVIAASWSALRDVLEGAYLRSARTCAVGDRVQVGAVRGRIQRLGFRNVYIEGTDGELAILPYRLVATQAILRSTDVERTAFHIFRVALPADRPLPELKRIVRETALINHWSSIARPPHIVATGNSELEVTVFAVDPDQAPEIERAVRVALSRPAPGS